MANNICGLCGEKLIRYGNNPWPLADEKEFRVCDDCNWLVSAFRVSLDLYNIPLDEEKGVINRNSFNYLKRLYEQSPDDNNLERLINYLSAWFDGTDINVIDKAAAEDRWKKKV